MTERSPTYRITDRSGLVHMVADHSGSLAQSSCGQSFRLGSGGFRIWQLVRGQQHEICVACRRAEKLSALETAIRCVNELSVIAKACRRRRHDVRRKPRIQRALQRAAAGAGPIKASKATGAK